MMTRVVILCTVVSVAAAAAPCRDSLSGAALLDELRASHAPHELTATHGLPYAVARCDTDGTGEINNRFDDSQLTPAPDGNCSYTCILPGEWWRQDCPSRDLHNLVAAPAWVSGVKGDSQPGAVTAPSFINDRWSAGTGSVTGMPVSCYTPPEGYEGDFARAALYVMTLYGDLPVNGGNAYNFISIAPWPGIEAHALRQLIAWSDSDPVDSRELMRDNIIASIQGNHNPYVTDPSLVRRVYAPDDPGMPDVPVEPEATPLRGVYTAADKYVWLISPYIPADARWRVDGVCVDSDRIAVKNLTPGHHTLTFSSEVVEGSLQIEIRP